MKQILLIDQHSSLALKLQNSLLLDKLEVVQAADKIEASSKLRELEWHLVVIGEPRNSTNEISLLLEVRAKHPHIPILVMIRSIHATDRIRMFRLGANDVLSLPYHIDELIERILKLSQHHASTPLSSQGMEVGDLIIDTENRRVSRGEGIVQLTQTEYDLLVFLSLTPGKVRSRESILYEVWGYEFKGNTNIVDVYIRYLRIKIDKGHKKKLIKTVHGLGYMISI